MTAADRDIRFFGDRSGPRYDRACDVNSIDAKGVGTAIGSVTFQDTKWDLLITQDLSRLVPGVHGFHVHEKAVCGTAGHEGKLSAGFAAGGHYDPQHTNKHLGAGANKSVQGRTRYEPLPSS